MSDIKLSVIVPVYNMGADGRLEYCMNSLLAQTLEDMEIIAVDDASTDNSREILEGYVHRNPGRVKLLCHSQNKRQGGARNTGLKAAAGEWIGFVDSDDWVAPECYEKLLDKALKTGADMVGCDYNLVHEHTMEVGEIIRNNSMEQTGPLDYEKHKKLLMRSGSMVIKIYRHSVIRENNLSFPEGIFYEDNCAGPLWSLYFNHFEKVQEPLYYYYQHGGSTVHYITEEKCRDRMKAAVLFYEECKRGGYLETYYSEIEYRFSELYYVITLFSYLSGVKHPRLSFVKELRRGVEERFPDFETNPYYKELTGGEEQELIAMQGRSALLFFHYYRLKRMVRGMIKALRGDGTDTGKQ